MMMMIFLSIIGSVDISIELVNECIHGVGFLLC